jgi:hypothetical protein
LRLRLSAHALKVFFSTKNLNLASREGPVREERSRGCLGAGRPPKTPLDDAGPKRGEVIGRGRLILGLD